MFAIVCNTAITFGTGVFGALIAAQQGRLRALYASAATPDELRAEKRAAFDALRGEYAALKASWGGAADYDAWFAQPLNNAALAAVATYTGWVPALKGRLAAVGLTAFYADAAALAELATDERAARLIPVEVDVVVAAHEDQRAGGLTQQIGDLCSMRPELLDETQLGRVFLSVLDRCRIKAAEIGECAQIARLQDQVDALSGHFLPFGAQIEAAHGRHVHVEKNQVKPVF